MKIVSQVALVMACAGSFICTGQTAPVKPAPPKAKAVSIPDYRALKYPPIREVKIPDIPLMRLPNGMRLYLLENHELPLVSGFAVVKTGNLFDPKDKIGLASVTGEVMRTGGTKSRKGEALDETLENVAASVESNIGETSGRVSFNSLKENTDLVLSIFKEVLTSPEFSQDKIDLVKGQMKGSISRRNDNAHGVSAREFSDTVYGKDNPYGWSMEYEHVENIKRDDLIAFHKRYYFPENIILAVQGDFNAPEMKAKIEKLFADWTVKQAAVPEFPGVSAKPAPGVYLATKNDVTQTFFQMGHMGGKWNDKNYPALEVMSDILGGGFSGRLFKRVRTELGYAYSIGGGWGVNYNHPGLFRISGSTKSQSTIETVEAVREEIAKMRDSEVTDQELQTSKQSVLNAFVFNFDHPGKTLGRMVNYEYFGYPRDFIFQYQKGIENVSKADVLRVSRDYMKPADMTIVAVGKPADFGKDLSVLGPVKKIDLTIPGPKKEKAKADPASLAKGKQLLQRAQEAVGGADKIAAIKDSSQSGEMEVNTGQGAMKVKQTTMWMAPNVVRQTQELPFGKVVVYFDGAGGWMKAPQGEQPLPPPVIQQIQEQMFRVMPILLMSDRDANRVVNAVGPNAVEITDQQGHSVKLEFDPATGLPHRQTYQLAAGASGPATTMDTFSDWKDTGGIKLPRKVTIERDGKKFADLNISEVTVNGGLTKESLSAKP